MGRIKPSTPSTTAVENPAVQLASLKIPEIPFDETLRFQFTNTRIEKKVFAHRSISANTVSMDNNEHLEFVGDAILKGLTATLIDDLYPDFDEKRMSLLHKHLIKNTFYAHISRLFRLNERLQFHESAQAVLDSENVLADLFEAYVAGIYAELGPQRYYELYCWFDRLMRPYAIDFCHQLQELDGWESKQVVLPPITTEDTAANDLYILAQRRKLGSPQIRFTGPVGSHLYWTCHLKLGNVQTRASAQTKKRAKNLAAKDAYAILTSRCL